MIEIVKNKIWDLLKEKNVSLAMIYDRRGHILWHRGRQITGRDIYNGDGFCKSYIQESLLKRETIDSDGIVTSDPGDLSRSAVSLLVRSVIIYPIASDFFLYVDSGKRESFNQHDRVALKILGELLEQTVTRMQTNAHVVDLGGQSEGMAAVRNQVIAFAMEEEPVLLTGETGVGKNHVAQLIHRYSGRTGKLVVVDTPNIQDNLFESKLFGHTKGSFTDAAFSKTGLVSEAEKGTLFFDEITEVPMEVQARLLRFFDTRRFTVLGESVERVADVRIIVATNRSLPEAVAQKLFRQDLYFRLNILELEIPPLRSRPQDIKPLVLENIHLLRDKTPLPDFWDALTNYSWPGNVRQLISFLKRAGIMLESPISGAQALSLLQKTIPPSHPDISPYSGHAFTEAPSVQTPADAPFPTPSTHLESVKKMIADGVSFWDALWNPFIDRDFDRSTVKEILGYYYAQSNHHFKRMTAMLNIPAEDYQKFMSLLYKYKIDPRK